MDNEENTMERMNPRNAEWCGFRITREYYAGSDYREYTGPLIINDMLPAEPILKSTTVSENHISDRRQCSVCLIDFTIGIHVQELTCGHIFHENCITPWIKLHSTCPFCRSQLKQEMNYTYQKYIKKRSPLFF
ncbi:E3 ubiquitin-protein ligase RNF126-A-like isoform X2 [Sipha flava]|nr:E3 ubiquitin-protein ligase RNF126-A-like isoform X2 [Sipha flava]